MKNRLVIVAICSFSFLAPAQTMRLEGKIVDGASGLGLNNAIIMVNGNETVICPNGDGVFFINSPRDSSILFASALGYQSVRTTITRHDTNRLLISLLPSKRLIPSGSGVKNYSVSEIMLKATDAASAMRNRASGYESDLISRCVTRADNVMGIASGASRFGMEEAKESMHLISSLGDSSVLQIKNICFVKENFFYNPPAGYKEIVSAKSMNGGLPSPIVTLTGNRLFQNFYDEELTFFDHRVPGPLAANASNFYNYSLADTLMMNDELVYKISFKSGDPDESGFIGFLYLSATTFRMIQADVELNRTANIGGTFNSVGIRQKFHSFAGDVCLPVDYTISADVSYLGLAKGSYELRTVANQYNFNELSDAASGDVILKVLPGAYKQDNNYWQAVNTVPQTVEESAALRRLDSIRSVPPGFWEKAYREVTKAQYQLDDNYSITSLAGMYQFNHVEGHTVSFGINARHFLLENIDTKLALSQGFSDKRFKEQLTLTYATGEFQENKALFSAYNKLATLFASSDGYSSLTNTILALWSKHDARSYYYTKGFDVGFESEVLQILKFTTGFSSHTDISTIYHTSFSLFGGSRTPRSSTQNSGFTSSTLSDTANSPINDGYYNTLSAGFNFDFRPRAEDNRISRRMSNGKSFVTFGGGVFLSDSRVLKSAASFTSYNINIQGAINTFKTASLGFKITGVYSDGPVPYQLQYALPGNISAGGKSYSFRTVGLSNMFGDQILTLTMEHNFREEFLRLLPFSSLRSINLQLSTFFTSPGKICLKNLPLLCLCLT